MDGMAALSPTLNMSQSLGQSKIALAKRGVSAEDTDKIDKVSKDFEAVFLSQMMENMFADVDMDPMSEGPGDDIYKSMMLNEYGRILSNSGGIGIADYVKKEMLSIQEKK
jgi:flagellar protein FlgJ